MHYSNLCMHTNIALNTSWASTGDNFSQVDNGSCAPLCRRIKVPTQTIYHIFPGRGIYSPEEAYVPWKWAYIPQKRLASIDRDFQDTKYQLQPANPNPNLDLAPFWHNDRLSAWPHRSATKLAPDREQ